MSTKNTKQELNNNINKQVKNLRETRFTIHYFTFILLGS